MLTDAIGDVFLGICEQFDKHDGAIALLAELIPRLNGLEEEMRRVRDGLDACQARFGQLDGLENETATLHGQVGGIINTLHNTTAVVNGATATTQTIEQTIQHIGTSLGNIEMVVVFRLFFTKCFIAFSTETLTTRPSQITVNALTRHNKSRMNFNSASMP